MCVNNNKIQLMADWMNSEFLNTGAIWPWILLTRRVHLNLMCHTYELLSRTFFTTVPEEKDKRWEKEIFCGKNKNLIWILSKKTPRLLSNWAVEWMSCFSHLIHFRTESIFEYPNSIWQECWTISLKWQPIRNK